MVDRSYCDIFRGLDLRSISPVRSDLFQSPAARAGQAEGVLMPIPMSSRNREIIAFYEANDWSYQLVGDKFHVSRFVVAGLMFRHRHPPNMRVDKHGNKYGSGRAKIGTGYRSGPSPTYTARNSR